MLYIAWIITALAVLIFVGATLANIQYMFIIPSRLREGERAPSMIPLLGGLAGMIAIIAAPLPALKPWFWIPFLLDPGSALYTFFALLAGIDAKLHGIDDENAIAEDSSPLTKMQQAIVGTLLGIAVGDALGLASEGLSKQRRQKLFPRLDRYSFFFGLGFCSDDTEHACLVAQSLTSTATVATELQPREFAANLGWRLRFWLLGLPAGVGFATLRSILKLLIGFPPSKSGVCSAGNGPAMRSPIIGVCYGDEPELMLALVNSSTRITHTDPRALAGALTVAWAAYCAAFRKEDATWQRFPESLQQHFASSLDNELSVLLRQAAASAGRNEESELFAAAIGCASGISGYMPHTVAMAIHAWLRYPEDYHAAVSAVIACGGDTDTVAAIVGGIVGAGTGKKGIPKPLRESLWEWPRSVIWMETLGMRLGQAINGEKVKPVTVKPYLLLLRNLLFLVVVLSHGLRRLLPPY